MIFKLILKLAKANSEEERLKWSVYYGWGLVGMSLVMFILFRIASGNRLENEALLVLSGYGLIISFFLFVFRYTSVKPFLGAAAGGITVLSIATILDNLSNRRDGGLSFGALVGVIAVLAFIILKNLIISFYYLSKETYRYYKYVKGSEISDLEETVLN